MQKKQLLLSAVLICLGTASASLGTELHGRSSTQASWSNDIFSGEKQLEFSQYLNLSVSKIDAAGKLSLSGYGRITQEVQDGDGFHHRLYYLTGEYKDFMGHADIRLGRQYVNYAAGSALIDGGEVDIKKFGPVAFSVMGGRNLYFDLDSEATTSKDYVWAAAGRLDGFKSTDAEISYFMKLDQAGIAKDSIGGSFKQYLFNNAKLYGNARFDIATESFNEVLAGVKYFPTSDLVLTGEWYQSYPSFDNSSIYSVFAVSRYQEALVKADYSVNDKLGVNVGYTHQDYEGDVADVFEIGTRIRPIEHLKISLSYDKRVGYGGSLDGGSVEVSYEPMKKLDVAAGIHFDMYEVDRVTGKQTARKYWLGSSYKFTDKISASVRAENNVNEYYKEDWQGRAVLNYDF